MEKERFLQFCKQNADELNNVINDIEFEENGTLADIGCNYSFELANIGFELGYASWVFLAKGDYKEVLQSFINIIIENEQIEGVYTKKALDNIKNRMKNCKENS